jgi:DNA-binding transcriptional LysR family regulator
MARINIKQLEAFLQVADQGSFRRAAERLNTTQPNISSRISGLEDQLGQRLMERDAGSVRLTPFGQRMLPRARQVVRALDGFLLAAEDDALFEGVLRIGVTEMIVHSWLGGFLKALKERFANIDIDLMVDLSDNLSPALFSRSIDLALQSGPFSRQSTGALDLGSFPMIWVAAPGLDLAGRVLSLDDLSTQPVLTHARGTLPFQQLHSHFAAHPETPVRLVPSTNIAACLQMTREGLGVACLPEAMVRGDIGTGALVALNYGWLPDDLWFQARFDAEAAPHFVAEAARLAEQISHSYRDGHKG